MSAHVTPTSRAGSTVRQAAAQPWLEALERLGYVVRGLVYGLMGWLALQLAVGRSGAATDQAGSIVVLAGTPLGRPILFTVVVGLAAYSIWGFVRAVFDPWHRGTDASGIAQRLGYAWSGFAYASLALFAMHLFANGNATTVDSTQAAVRSLLTYPAGRLAAVSLGILTIGAGLAEFVDASKAWSQAGVVKQDTPSEVRGPLLWLGRFGMFSRGVVFVLIGWFVVQAGLHRDPSTAHGFQGAFAFLLAQPYGHLFLAVVALGFIALGLHSLALARWARLLRSS
jgi:hypothetical protein